MNILEIRALRGPNYFSRFQVIYLKLDIGELENKPTDKIPGFKDRLLKLLPTLSEHRCSPGHPGGFIERIERGTWMGHVTEHVAIELQCLANMEVGFGKTLDTDVEGVYDIVFRYRDEEAGIKAGREAVRIADAIYKKKPVDINSIILKLKTIRETNLLGPSTKSIVDEAKRRDIPIIRLNTESYVQLGHGINQRRIQATIMDNTSALGVEIADDKKNTKDILAQAGIPVPTGEVVTKLTSAYKVAEDIGYPIVVKPLVGNHGRGITVNITNKSDLKKAFSSAKKFRNKILIEKYIEGYDHRILTIDGKFVAASRREPPSVTGDGKSKIRQLIEKINQDPRRGFGHEKVLTKIEIDVMTRRLLRLKKLDLDDILPKGEVLYLKSTANLSMGGIAIDVTDKVHPMVRYMAERISKIIGLNVIGIDVLAKNLDKPISQTGGGVVEVNAAPGFRMHLDPFEGSPRNVAEPILDMLFPPGIKSTIPIIAVTGTNGKTTTVRLISHILKLSGKNVGMSSTDGIVIGNNMIIKGDYSGPEGTNIVLRDPTVDHAVLEIARGSILRRGLGYDESDVGVLLNIANDHLGEGGINTKEDLVRLKGVVIETVKPNGYAVLNADDILISKFKKEIKANVLMFSLYPDNPVIQEHLTQNGKVVTVDNDEIVIFEGSLKSIVVKVQDVPITLDGNAKFNISNALAATAACYALGVNVKNIQTGLITFNPTIAQSPGRMNLIKVGNFKVIVDYGHNVAAVKALSSVFAHLTSKKKIGMASGTGNRLDENIIEYGKTLGNIYDHIIITDTDPRDKLPGETADLVYKGVLSTGFPKKNVSIILDDRKATKAVLELAEDGDLVVIQADYFDRVIEDVFKFRDKLVNNK